MHIATSADWLFIAARARLFRATESEGEDERRPRDLALNMGKGLAFPGHLGPAGGTLHLETRRALLVRNLLAAAGAHTVAPLTQTEPSHSTGSLASPHSLTSSGLKTFSKRAFSFSTWHFVCLLICLPEHLVLTDVAQRLSEVP